MIEEHVPAQTEGATAQGGPAKCSPGVQTWRRIWGWMTAWFSPSERLPCLTFAQILAEEQSAIAGQRGEAGGPFSADDLGKLYSTINQRERTALCLSGGGIRSAAFSLGAIQRFSSVEIRARSREKRDNEKRDDQKQSDEKKPLLAEFDYLSTVSGGGYTGSWLSAWLYRARTDASKASVLGALDGRDKLSGSEPDPIHNLRKNANYLAPESRAFSPDVWNDIACILRNLLLNWIVILPAIGCAVVIVQLLLAWFASGVGPDWLGAVAVVIAGILASVSLGYTALHIPSRRMANARRVDFLVKDLFAWFAACLCVLCAYADWRGANQTLLAWHRSAIVLIGASAVIGSVWFVLIWGLSVRFREQKTKEDIDRTSSAPASMETGDRLVWWGRVGWALAGALLGGVLAVLAIAANGLLDLYSGFEGAILLLVIGLPLITVARLAAEVLFTAVSVRVNDADMNFEWLSRSGGYFALWSLGFGVVAALVAFGPWFLSGDGWPSGLLFGSSGLAGVLAALFGKSSHSGPLPDLAATARRYLTLDQLAQLGALLFGIGLVLGFAVLSDRFLFGELFAEIGNSACGPGWFVQPAIGAGVLAGASCAASCFVNVNRFSLHGLYRNRLMRTFLGASRSNADRDKTRDTFSDYDGNDTPVMRHLWTARPGDAATNFDNAHVQDAHVADWLPLHVVNVTANLASSKNLAWQERKAVPFTISPLHAGSCSLDARNHASHVTDCPAGAFLSTRYRGDTLKSYGGRYGLTLATAMAISGAAVSPNMGYYTSPGIAFLMTLFNVRLGWWLANPAKPTAPYWKTGPGISLGPLAREMFGLTNERARWLLLSDGGHFDNTGLYEMVRRRCRLIVLIDGGQDAHFQFADLGRTLMKIWIDFGIGIDFEGLDHLKTRLTDWPSTVKPSPYWAVAKIRYQDRDKDPSRDGILLYIKAGLHGTEPISVLSYGLTNTQFPNDTTLNQFYQESQFEAYRALGYEIANQALIAGGVIDGETGLPTSGASGMTLERIIEHIRHSHPCREKKGSTADSGWQLLARLLGGRHSGQPSPPEPR